MSPLATFAAAPRPTPTTQRRTNLLHWLHQRADHNALTASQIATRSGLYAGRHPADRCFDDLTALQRQGKVQRTPGRPARWQATRS